MTSELRDNHAKHKNETEQINTLVTTFLKGTSSGILVLESMHEDQRDIWLREILSKAGQAEIWVHSARIAHLVSRRIRFFSEDLYPESLYNVIYGGTLTTTNDDKVNTEEEEESEDVQEIVPLKSNNFLDESAVIILHEAHLITRSLHQSDFLRFGSGRLLDDLIQFLALKNNSRKLICIGDPYSLTFGKVEESALNLDILKSLFDGRNIPCFKQQPVEIPEGHGRLALRTNLALSLENRIFNNLQYTWQPNDLIHINEENRKLGLKKWFSLPLLSEPPNGCLVYTNEEAKQINQDIKENYLKNGTELAPHDLLIIHNNVNIPNKTGSEPVKKLYNGMYLLVLEIKEPKPIRDIKIKQSSTPITLNFTKLKVICLSLPNKPEVELWMLDKYFSSDGLSKNEQIALKVYVNQEVKKIISKKPFYSSKEDYEQLIQDTEYQSLSQKEKQDIEQLIKNVPVSTTQKARGLFNKYKKAYRRQIWLNIIEKDPFVNAVRVKHGWAITVNKSVGMTFGKVILNASQGENKGYRNPGYYRWLYSAITAAKEIIFVKDPQEISPLTGCDFKDEAQVTSKIELKNALAYPNYQVAVRFMDKVAELPHESVKGAICELSTLLEQHGILLNTISRNGDFLTKVHYSMPESNDKTLTIAIHNNKAGVISTIKIEKAHEINEMLVNEAINYLFSHPTGLEFPTDFRKPIYEQWLKLLRDKGWELYLVESHEYQDIFIVSNENQMAKFGLYYNNKGFFTKFIVIEKTNTQLGQFLEEWLLHGN